MSDRTYTAAEIEAALPAPANATESFYSNSVRENLELPLPEEVRRDSAYGDTEPTTPAGPVDAASGLGTSPERTDTETPGSPSQAETGGDAPETNDTETEPEKSK